MYLQETLSGHSEMAEAGKCRYLLFASPSVLSIIYNNGTSEEFSSWKWEIPIRISAACGWGLPDSNDASLGRVSVS